MASPRVIAIQFDGLRADTLSEERTPNLLAAAERGAWFRNHRSTFPTSTRVCVSSLATGVYPEKHGLPGNSLYSRELGETITTGRYENLLAWERAMGGRLLLRDTFSERLDGGVIIESVFSWPGMGQTLVSAAVAEDLPLAVGAFVFVGIFVLLAHLAVDVIYVFLDPRIRY